MSHLQLYCRPDPALLRPARDGGFALNTDAFSSLGKVKGKLGLSKEARLVEFQREAQATLLIAERPDVTEVRIGEEAYSFIYPTGGKTKKNCDVVGLSKGGVILGEGKGKDLMGALIQLYQSALAISDGGKGDRVTSLLVVTGDIDYLECPRGLSFTQAQTQFRSRSPNPTPRQARAVEVAKGLALYPRYDYLLVPEEEGVPSPVIGLGLAVSTSGDDFLYTNRLWKDGGLEPKWTQPIRKLVISATFSTTVHIRMVRDPSPSVSA